MARSRGSKNGIGAVDLTIAILPGDKWLNRAFRIVSPVAVAKAVNRAAGNQFTRYFPYSLYPFLASGHGAKPAYTFLDGRVSAEQFCN